MGSEMCIRDRLEVNESDFTKGISEMVAAEQTAAAPFDKETKENAFEKTTKNQDVKHKTKEAASLDKKASELTTDIDETTFEKNHLEMERGLKGVKFAFQILNDYFAKADKARKGKGKGKSKEEGKAASAARRRRLAAEAEAEYANFKAVGGWRVGELNFELWS